MNPDTRRCRFTAHMADYEHEQTHPSVGAGSPRTSPIYRPSVDLPVSEIFCENSLSALIGLNLTKWCSVLRRGEGGEEWMGGPSWSPASCSPGSHLGGIRSYPHPRATLKAHPYGSPGLLPDFPALVDAYYSRLIAPRCLFRSPHHLIVVLS